MTSKRSANKNPLSSGHYRGIFRRFQTAVPLRHFAQYALGHVSRLLGGDLVVDIDEAVVLRYQDSRLREKASPKSINEEKRFLLKMVGDSGELTRVHLRTKKQLKSAVSKQIGKSFDSKETENLTEKARESKNPHMYPAFMLARNAALRYSEIKTLTWGRINLKSKTLQVGKSKRNAGEGRIIPLCLLPPPRRLDRPRDVAETLFLLRKGKR